MKNKLKKQKSEYFNMRLRITNNKSIQQLWLQLIKQKGSKIIEESPDFSLWMMSFNKKIKTILLFSLVLMFFGLQSVMAHFVCGEVLDSADNMSSEWFEVRLFYGVNSTNCQVSPAGNKYCCDSESVRSWKIGEIINAEVFDNKSGYVAGPVFAAMSGEGYDVMPVMQLEKVIKIHSPFGRLIFSNNSSLLLNASFRAPYNLVELVNKGNKSILCTDCTQYSQDYAFDFGMNKIKINAINNGRIFSHNLNFAVLSSYNFTRDFYCDKCNGSKIRSDKNVSVSLRINLSNEIEGFELKEYVPTDWEIIEPNGGKISYYDENYSVISWNISGKDIEINYLLKSPKVRLFPLKYEFASELENILLNKSNILVYRIFPFFGTSCFLNLKQLTQKSYSRISPENSLVLNLNNQPIKKFALFPKKVIYNAKATISSYIPENKKEGAIGYYIIDSNVYSGDIEKVYLEIAYDKKFLEDQKFENLSFYSYINDEWEEIHLDLIKETENEIVYGGFIYNPLNRLAVVLKKNHGFFHFLNLAG
jgi:hypothetical protein